MGGVRGDEGEALPQIHEQIVGAAGLERQALGVALHEGEGGLLGEVDYGEGGAGAVGRVVVLGGDGRFVLDHLDVVELVFDVPGPVLIPNGVDDAVDEIKFDAVAGRVAGDVGLAKLVEVVDVFGDQDEVGGGQSVSNGVPGGFRFP